MIDVACAIIERDGLVLAAQRSERMNLPLKWEFPGGKLEPGENAAAALNRELREELDIAVSIHAILPPTPWRYPEFALTLHPFVCTIASGEIHLHEHRAIRWLSPERIFDLDWAAADGPVLHNYLRYLESR